MLWGRAGCRCSYASCRIELLHEDKTEQDNLTSIGEICHIVAKHGGGSRADTSMKPKERNSYENLILLCRNHHRVVDSQVEKYTVEFLHQMKKEHESWVKQQLGFDVAKQKDDEFYADLVDQWEVHADVDNWSNWSSYVLFSGDSPSIAQKIYDNLGTLNALLFNRVWPGRYPDLEKAFKNFRFILSDFQQTFDKHARSPENSKPLIRTEKFYQNEQNHTLRDKVHQEYEFHVDLVQDLMLELSRAANLICDRVRQHLSRSYRLNEGYLSVETGPYQDGYCYQSIPQYSDEERTQDIVYPGLPAFLTVRERKKR
jgi:hypothetical protein